jgi:hypothetical protein
MNNEQKDLLLKDICSRLPYGVKISIPDLWTQEREIEILDEIFKGDDGLYRVNSKGQCIEYIKPYLFPMSSMNEEQRNEYNRLRGSSPIPSYYCDDLGEIVEEGDLRETVASIDYLYKNHFDIHGLIPIGLAIDCTNLNIY